MTSVSLFFKSTDVCSRSRNVICNSAEAFSSCCSVSLTRWARVLSDCWTVWSWSLRLRTSSAEDFSCCSSSRPLCARRAPWLSACEARSLTSLGGAGTGAGGCACAALLENEIRSLSAAICRWASLLCSRITNTNTAIATRRIALKP